MTRLGPNENLDLAVEVELRRLEHARRVLEEQRAASARAAAYRDTGTWDDSDWWAKQLGRDVQHREAAPPF